MEHDKYDHKMAAAFPAELVEEHYIEPESAAVNGGFVNGAPDLHIASSEPSENLSALSIEEAEVVERLSPRQRDYYIVASFLVNQSNFTFTHPRNAGGELGRTLGFSQKDFEEINRKLKVYGLVEFEKKDDNKKNTRSIAVNLNVNGLLSRAMVAKEPSFITEGLLRTLDSKIQNGEGGYSEEDKVLLSARIEEAISAKAIKNLSPEERAERKKIRIEERKKEKVRVREQDREEKRKAKEERNRLRQEARAAVQEQRRIKEEKKRRKKADTMFFNFIAAGDQHTNVIGAKKFKDWDPQVKLLYAIGLSATFAASRDDQEYVALELLNKEVEEDKFDKKSYSTLLENTQEEGLITVESPIFQLTKSAMIKLNQFKWSNSSQRLKGEAQLEAETLAPEGTDNESSESNEAQDNNSDKKETEDYLKENGIYVALDNLMPDYLKNRLLDEDSEDDSEEENKDKKERQTEWQFGRNNNRPIVNHLMISLGREEETARKTTTFLKTKGYLEVESTVDGYTNIGFTDKGMKFWKEHYLKKQEHLEKVDEIIMMVQTCLELVSTLGKKASFIQKIESRTKQEYQTKLEKNQKFFDEELDKVETMLKELRDEYAQAFRRVDLASAA